MANSLSDHVVLVGLGRLGYRTFRLLDGLGENVVVIERDPECSFLDEVRRRGAPLLVGDGRRDELLRDANMAEARSVIIATNDDLANLEIALDARRMNPRVRVVLRLFDQALADKVRDAFTIHLAMSTSAISAPIFALPAYDASIVSSFVVDDQIVVMQRWLVQAGGLLAGQTVRSALDLTGFSVLRRLPRGGAVALFPPPETLLEDGDDLLVQGSFDSLRQLRRKHRGADGFIVEPPLPDARAERRSGGG